ncbi:MAG: thioredoxin family protein [Gammaproteobacteria bacterium]|nr:thiol-disulfide isomerase [Gammaproteobacteria bacterium]
MKSFVIRAAALAAFALGLAQSAQGAGLGYDPEADPFEQYHEAMAQAQREQKLVLIVAGGDWCRWCHVLERFIADDPEIAARLHETFVVMKVYVGFDNYNDLFFSQLPPAKGAPHFWIMSPEREVLASQSTGALEAGKDGYDKQAFIEFIEYWQAQAKQARTPKVVARS